MIFLKSGSSVVPNEGRIRLPKFSSDIHHECELAFRFDEQLRLSEMTLALDLTARDAQAKLKANGHPWTLAKSFKASCPIGPFVQAPADVQNIRFVFRVNGEMRQSGHSADMIHSVERLRSFVIERFPVVPGDLLLTGTPKGVSALNAGDRLEAEVEGVLLAKWTIDPST
jgi:2-keto-4-pentenoate hydratase/2-oxohepta-3-ene-1,7-dioic acid hydratase in catechol pathway